LRARTTLSSLLIILISEERMVEGEKIVFKLSKTLWNECREKELKLLERLEAKEAELANTRLNKTYKLHNPDVACEFDRTNFRWK
jgi:hypothetical protein